MIDPRTHENLWAENYDRVLTEIFAIQSEVAQEIAAALKAELTPPEKALIEKRSTEDIEAYNLFLMGRHFRNLETVESLKTAVDFYQQAIQKDPDYAEAYAGLAETGYLLAYYEPGWEWTNDRAEAELQRAFELDDEIAAAHVMKGNFAQRNDFAGAERHYQIALELDPNLVNAHREYGLFLLRRRGMFDEALLKLEEARRLDPLSPLINDHLVEVYVARADMAKAMEADRIVRELAPDWGHLNLAAVGLVLGEYEKAESEAKKALENSDNYAGEWLLTLTYLCQGKMELASEVSRRRLSTAPHNRHWAIAGIVALWAGNHADARSFLERAYAHNPTGTTGASSFWPAHWRYSTPLAHILWKGGDYEAAEKILSENLRLDSPERIETGAETAAPKRLYDIAMINAIRGEKEAAYRWLKKAIDAGWRYCDITSKDPIWSDCHDEERFQRMMSAVKAKVEVMRARVREMEKESELE